LPTPANNALGFLPVAKTKIKKTLLFKGAKILVRKNPCWQNTVGTPPGGLIYFPAPQKFQGGKFREGAFLCTPLGGQTPKKGGNPSFLTRKNSVGDVDTPTSGPVPNNYP